MPRCPGQDMRYWKPEDIFDVACFSCGANIEFWKDEPFRICKGCGKEVRNPRIDLGCAKWCKYADECLGKNAVQPTSPVAPLIDRLELLLEGYFAGSPERIKTARRLLDQCEKFTQSHNVDPCLLQAGAMLTGALFVNSLSEIKWDDFKAMLERAGMEASVADRICKLVALVLADGAEDSEEFKALSDILGIEKIKQGQRYKFKTQFGEKIASQKK